MREVFGEILGIFFLIIFELLPFIFDILDIVNAISRKVQSVQKETQTLHNI